jgi:glutamyl-tRNA reductase
VNLLVVGASHHTAPVELLERLAVPTESVGSTLSDLIGQSHVNEAVLLSTCNRVEVYAAVRAFHGGLADIGAILSERAGMDTNTLASHLYVRYDLEAIRHAMRVASGLDSMVVGEAQILGQLREAYATATDSDTVGRLLHELMQQALRVGKRVHAETGIDRAGQSVVSAALELAPGGVQDRSALVVGAGSMGGLALATLRRAGVGPLFLANRAPERARRQADLHGATAVNFADLAAAVSAVDIVLTATASSEPVLTAETVRTALQLREPSRPLVILDLAVPRDVAPEVADLPGVTLIDLDRVGLATMDQPSGADQLEAEAIVVAESETFLTWLRGAEVAPTVAALRARADEVVEAELRRLAQRRPDLTEEQRADITRAVHRVVQQLLHSPTVRVRQLATTPGGDQYAAVLRELFDLSVPDDDDDFGRAVELERGEVDQ